VYEQSEFAAREASFLAQTLIAAIMLPEKTIGPSSSLLVLAVYNRSSQSDVHHDLYAQVHLVSRFNASEHSVCVRESVRVCACVN
jgi:hypothetical protein